METGKQDACDSIMYGDCCSLSFNQGHISQPMINCPPCTVFGPMEFLMTDIINLSLFFYLQTTTWINVFLKTT